MRICFRPCHHSIGALQGWLEGRRPREPGNLFQGRRRIRRNTNQNQKLSELVNDFVVRLASVPPGPLTKEAAENVEGLLATIWNLEGREKRWNERVQAWTSKCSGAPGAYADDTH
jgi:hypothetical protein